MAEIINPEVIKFSNETIRPMADRLARMFYFAEGVQDLVSAKPQLLDELLKGGDLKDGAEVDGRPPLTGEQIKTIIEQVNEFVADYRANDSAKLKIILQASVNPQS